ncbi:hypothetical protein NC651_009192 [Populus alba x Populus x berolinensis]|nr:hypothetical protein NC651_009192 [Populus alba x Populus x berolinensis]
MGFPTTLELIEITRTSSWSFVFMESSLNFIFGRWFRNKLQPYPEIGFSA